MKAEHDLSISCGGIIQQATQRLSRGSVPLVEFATCYTIRAQTLGNYM